MNDLQRVDLKDTAIKPRLSPARRARKVTIYLLATLIVTAMIAWLGFLGWGVIGLLQWLLACTKSFWTTHF
jgi:hypothetical protein